MKERKSKVGTRRDVAG